MHIPEAEPVFGSTSAPLPHEFWDVAEAAPAMDAVVGEAASMSHPLLPMAAASRPMPSLGDPQSPLFLRRIGEVSPLQAYLESKSSTARMPPRTVGLTEGLTEPYMSVMPTSGALDEFGTSSPMAPAAMQSARLGEGCGRVSAWLQDLQDCDVDEGGGLSGALEDRPATPLAIEAIQVSSSSGDGSVGGRMRRGMMRLRKAICSRRNRVEICQGRKAAFRRCVQSLHPESASLYKRASPANSEFVVLSPLNYKSIALIMPADWLHIALIMPAADDWLQMQRALCWSASPFGAKHLSRCLHTALGRDSPR